MKRTTDAPGSSGDALLPVLLAAVDPEREPGRRQHLHGSVRPDEPRWRVAGVRGGELAGLRVEDGVDHRQELAERDLLDDDVVRAREERPGLRIGAGERAERELRHRHVRRGLDPLADHVADAHGDPPVLEREDVVDIAAHVDLRRRLVDVADLETRNFGERAREERSLHRLGEVALLLRQAGVVDREPRLRGDGGRGLECVGVERARRVERDQRQHADHLRRRDEWDDRGRRALGQERPEEGVVQADRARPRGEEGLAAFDHAREVRIVEGPRAAEDGGGRAVEGGVGDMDRARLEHLAAAVRHAHDGRVDAEQLDHRRRDNLERPLEGKTPCELVRDLPEAAELAGAPPLGGERPLEDAAELLRALVQASVLDCDGQLARECDEEALLPLAVGPRPLTEDGERPDHLVADRERDHERPPHAGLGDRRLEPDQAQIAPQVGDNDEPLRPGRAERDLEQPLGQRRMVAGQPARRGRDEVLALTQVDPDRRLVRRARRSAPPPCRACARARAARSPDSRPRPPSATARAPRRRAAPAASA